MCYAPTPYLDPTLCHASNPIFCHAPNLEMYYAPDRDQKMCHSPNPKMWYVTKFTDPNLLVHTTISYK